MFGQLYELKPYRALKFHNQINITRFARLSLGFRQELYQLLPDRADALMDWLDALDNHLQARSGGLRRASAKPWS